jgi:hypothetical protein
VLLDQPWADETVPSLVYTYGDGSIVGFLGSSVRRGRFDGRPIRIGCAGQLVAHPDARHRAVGAMLVRAYLDGDQDLTITDTGSDTIRRLWILLGGQMVHLGCLTWVRVLRPWALAERFLRERRGSRRGALPTWILAAADGATTKWIPAAAPPGEAELPSEALTPAALTEQLKAMAAGVRLYVDYDEHYLTWLFGEIGAMPALGTLVARSVRAHDCRPLGWYLYYLLPGGISRVLQVAAEEREAARVVDHMFAHAWSGGAAGLVGRVEPRLLEPLASRRSLMLYAGPAALVHSRDPEIIGAITSGKSLLSRLDGEWWMQDELVDLRRTARPLTSSV